MVKIQVFKGQNQPTFSDHGMVNSGLKMTESLIFVYKSQNFSAQYTIIHKTQYTNTIHTNTGALYVDITREYPPRWNFFYELRDGLTFAGTNPDSEKNDLIILEDF